MNKPELLHITPQGGTIHTYDIQGGSTTFHRFLACTEGDCQFFNTKKEATDHVYQIST